MIRKDGTIIPIKLRVQDDESTYQIYSIREYKELDSDTIVLSNETIVTSNIMRYDCKIEVFGMLKRIVLHYNKSQVKWYIYY
ncbi:MAG: hypothetical protein PUG10_03225 [Lachnospiraceae bacterium]|nr:hypothetical protein [Lachnospiraceae bacterium]